MTPLEAALRAEIVERVKSRRWYRAHRDWHMRDLEAENDRVLRLLLRLRREGRVREDRTVISFQRAYALRNVEPATESELRMLWGDR